MFCSLIFNPVQGVFINYDVFVIYEPAPDLPGYSLRRTAVDAFFFAWCQVT